MLEQAFHKSAALMILDAKLLCDWTILNRKAQFLARTCHILAMTLHPDYSRVFAFIGRGIRSGHAVSIRDSLHLNRLHCAGGLVGKLHIHAGQAIELFADHLIVVVLLNQISTHFHRTVLARCCRHHAAHHIQLVMYGQLPGRRGARKIRIGYVQHQTIIRGALRHKVQSERIVVQLQLSGIAVLLRNDIRCSTSTPIFC